MKLSRRTVLAGVVRPQNRARLFVEGEYRSGAGAEKESIPTDRGGHEDSAVSIETPGVIGVEPPATGDQEDERQGEGNPQR